MFLNDKSVHNQLNDRHFNLLVSMMLDKPFVDHLLCVQAEPQSVLSALCHLPSKALCSGMLLLCVSILTHKNCWQRYNQQLLENCHWVCFNLFSFLNKPKNMIHIHSVIVAWWYCFLSDKVTAFWVWEWPLKMMVWPLKLEEGSL